MDPWYGLGTADMLDVAHMAVHAVPMTSREAIRWTFDAVTEDPGPDHGAGRLRAGVGAIADLVLLQAADPIEAVRLRPRGWRWCGGAGSSARIASGDSARPSGPAGRASIPPSTRRRLRSTNRAS